MTPNWLDFIQTADDISYLAEGSQLECKAAQGKDKQGEIPKDFWPTYSAFANTAGGIVLLGVSEDDEGFHVLGIADEHRLRHDLWTLLNNREKISTNLLTEQDIQPLTLDEKTIIAVRVPTATRQQRPVYIGQNPLTGTYVRRMESDQLADNAIIQRFMAEKVEDSRDDKILPHFGLDDLDQASVQAYRNRFSAIKPESEWLELSLTDFLFQIGVTGKNRETGETGLRLGGLLMFGKHTAILDACPNYMLDYREIAEPDTVSRWTDRVIPDGTWSGNVYDFFRRVYPKLVADLKIPFQLKNGQRIDETPIHTALREALVNTLVHADYQGRTPTLVIKRPDMFSFRNSGRMRIPIELAIEGNNSDCRNRRIQQLFRHIGYVEQAGSGIPQIYRAWKQRQWQQPRFIEQLELDQTLMELQTSSLFPTESIETIRGHIGTMLDNLSDNERTALLLSQTEGNIRHARLADLCTDHRTDISKMLAGLVRKSLLIPEGKGRGMTYHLPWQDIAQTEPLEPMTPDLFEVALKPLSTESESLSTESDGLSTKSESLSTESDGLSTESENELNIQADSDYWQKLLLKATPYRQNKRVTSSEQINALKTIILQLCEERYLEGEKIAQLLDRNAKDLRHRYLNPLVEAGLLELRNANRSASNQAYKTRQI